MEIKIYKYPKDTKDLLIRDFDPNLIGEAVSAISDIINDIEENCDTALLKYERQFDCPSIESLKVTELEFEEAEAAVSQELKGCDEGCGRQHPQVSHRTTDGAH